MSTTAVEKAYTRLISRRPEFGPKHPDRAKMRRYERDHKVNATPIVHDSNGWSPNTGTVARTVDWAKQDRIPVGELDTSLWAAPLPRGGHVSAGKGRGNKGPKNSK
jgi:hypothetical protein